MSKVCKPDKVCTACQFTARHEVGEGLKHSFFMIPALCFEKVMYLLGLDPRMRFLDWVLEFSLEKHIHAIVV